jgi:hypothetical protein
MKSIDEQEKPIAEQTMEIRFQDIVSDTGQKYKVCSKCGEVVKTHDELMRHLGKHGVEMGEKLMSRIKDFQELIDKDMAKMEKDMRRMDIYMEVMRTIITLFLTGGYLASMFFGRYLYLENPNEWVSLLVKGSVGGGWGFWMTQTYLIRYLEYKRNKEKQKWQKQMEELASRGGEL